MSEGRKPEPFIDGEVIEIKVNCREDAGKIQSPVAYGLAVPLEVSKGVDIAVYNEIRTRIRLTHFDNCIIFQAILRFHRPTERRKS